VPTSTTTTSAITKTASSYTASSVGNAKHHDIDFFTSVRTPILGEATYQLEIRHATRRLLGSPRDSSTRQLENTIGHVVETKLYVENNASCSHGCIVGRKFPISGHTRLSVVFT
jgi:hypothetical protein